jgi:Fe-S cluster assembly protein SufD
MSHPRSIPFAYAGSSRPALPGGAHPWLATLRREALERFAETGLPSTRVEAWKYTNLKTLADIDLRTATGDDAKAEIAAEALPAIDGAYRVVFVNGRHRPDLSAAGPAPAGISLSTVGQAAATDDVALKAALGAAARPDGHVLVNLNTAFLADGCVLRVAPGATVEPAIHLVFVAADGAGHALAHHPRNVIVVGEGSRATVVESHVAMADGTVYWSNPVAEVVVEKDARLEHVKVQADSRAATHLAFSRARVAAGGHYESFVMTLGALLSRNEIEVVLDGEEAQCHLNGAYLINGRQHADTTTFIEHAKPNCESREVYKGVLDGKARGVFQGKIRVAPDAQKTNGHQLNRVILLSDEAEASAKPELEIYADDVKCSHGATVGELDDESMFYLRSRGIPEAEARRLLIRAFIGELVDGIAVDAVRTYLEGLLDAWLNEIAAEGNAA